MTLCRLSESINFNMWALLQVRYSVILWYLWLVLADYKFCGSHASFLGYRWITVQEGICACCLSVYEFLGTLLHVSVPCDERLCKRNGIWVCFLLFLYYFHLPFYLSIVHVMNECIVCLRRVLIAYCLQPAYRFTPLKLTQIVYSNKDSTEPASSIIRDGLVSSIVQFHKDSNLASVFDNQTMSSWSLNCFFLKFIQS